ncbi:MAG: arylesterase [Neomegalonema sp.]|nr:arylesterase [Neomegalonema sp.]
MIGASAARAESQKPITVLMYGDSLIAGYGLLKADGLVMRLEDWLKDQGLAVRLINAGVSGDTTSAGRARLDWTTPPDADAVLLELGANDALRGIEPEIARDNLDAMITAFKGKGLAVMLAGMYAPRNWGSEYAAAFDAMYPELAAKHEVPLYPFFLEGVAGERALNQSDGIHPNKAGVGVLVERLGPVLLNWLREVQASSS